MQAYFQGFDSRAALVEVYGPPSASTNDIPRLTHSPENAQGTPPSSTPHSLNPRSCITCRKRKVKCDKTYPCSNCSKAQNQCVFPAPGRAPRRPRVGKPASEREVELLKRLRRLEGVVEELSSQVDVEPLKQSPSSDSSLHRDGDANPDSSKSSGVRVVGMDEGTSKKAWMKRNLYLGGGPPKSDFGIGSLVLEEGKSSYVSSPFWSSVSDEIQEIRDTLTEHASDSDSDAPVIPSDITTSNHQGFIMGYSSTNVNLKELHPLPSQIPFYWQTFLENVNPLSKILHTQTMNKVIKEVQSNLDSLSPSTEALMFAIYFATITSMDLEEVSNYAIYAIESLVDSKLEVRINFGVTKFELLKKYRFGVEQALAKAAFLSTKEIVTVQAFVLFLLCVRRNDDTRFVWSLTGLAVRIAQSLGLHRDGKKFGLTPFDTEMRRRLWWQIVVLDVRASEDYGSEPSIFDHTWDCEFPLSVNDEELDPDTTEEPSPRKGVSEMTFCLVRYEICAMTRQISFVPPGGVDQHGPPAPTALPIEEKEKIIQDCAKKLEENYLQYCDNAGPLCWVAATVARLIIAKVTLVIYHPIMQPGKANDLPQDTKDRLLIAAIEIMDQTRMLECERNVRKWGWLFHTYVQWHAIAYILGELSIRDNSPLVERAWQCVDNVFNGLGGAMSSRKSGPLWQPMRKLIAKARRKREEIGQQPDENAQSLSSNTPAIPYDSITDTAMLEPQPPNFDLLLPTQTQSHVQHSQQPQASWIMDDKVLSDLDMNTVDGEVNWEGWDDLVRDFQPDSDNQMMGDARGPAMSGMGNWW
ncbi:hypothetical protein B7494_g3 [Chlorociboria aeruginascens]|nr:hypothetical protein B7494_g3 [Chlorociboria aeruginascens]